MRGHDDSLRLAPRRLAIAKSKPKAKTSATADQLDRAFTLLTASLAQHGDDLYRAGLETCLRALAAHAPRTFVAMAATVGKLFAEHLQTPPMLAKRLHNLGSAKFIRESSVSPTFAAEMHEHYYSGLMAAARAALRPLRSSWQAAKRAARRRGQTLSERLSIDNTIANQAADILVREVSKLEARDRAAVFFLPLPSNDGIHKVAAAEEGDPPAFPALFLKPADDRRRQRARQALFTNPTRTRPTWGDRRNAADVALMLLVLGFGKHEITTPGSWMDKVKQGREAEKVAENRGV